MKAFWPAFPFTDGLYFLLLGWFDIFMCMWLSKLKSWLLHSWTLCFFLCSRVKELKRAREHETPQKSSLAMWHHSPDSSFLFVCTRDILQEKLTEKKKRNTTNASTAIITTTAVLLVQLRLHIQQHFFHISILSTDLILVGEWQLLQDYKLKG